MKKAGAILIVFLLAVMVLTACGLTTREPIPAPTVVPVTVTPTVSPAIPEPVILFPDATDTLALFTTYLEANSDLSAWLEEGYGYSLNQPGVLLAAGAGPCFWISTKDRAGITQTEWQGMNAEEQKRWFRTHFFKNALVINSEAEAVFSVLSEEEVDNAMRVQKPFALRGFFILDQDGRIIAYRWLTAGAPGGEAVEWEEIEVESGDHLKALSAEKRKELDPALERIIEGVERRQTGDEGKIEGPVLKIVRLGKGEAAYTKAFLTDANGGIYVLDQSGELHLLPMGAELYEGSERVGWEEEGNFYYWDWEEQEERLIARPVGMLDLEGFEERWNPEQQQWEYVDKGGEVAAFWQIDSETGTGRIELVVVEGVAKLKSEWQGLYYRAEFDEVKALFQRQLDLYGKAFLLPADPTLPGTEITFSGNPQAGWTIHDIHIETPNQLLIRAPIAGKAYILQFGSKPYHAEREKATIELRGPPLGLLAGSENHAFFNDDYEYLPPLPPPDYYIEIGTPWIRVPVGEDGIASVKVEIVWDASAYNDSSPELITLGKLMDPQNLLRAEDGRIVYIAQE